MIVAIDPGGTTGIAVYHNNEYQTMVLPLDKVMQWLADMPKNPDAVVVEFFATAGRLSKYGLQTIDLVGQIKGYCFANGIKCAPQSPMSRKGWLLPASKILENRMIANRFDRPLVHEIDALAHLLEYQESAFIGQRKASPKDRTMLSDTDINS